MSTVKELCPVCQGTGYVTRRIKGKIVTANCEFCQGIGTRDVEYPPPTPEEQKHG